MIKRIFWPISFLYAQVLQLRHWLFDKHFFKSSPFNFPLICVGNLALGGTGKSPMTEYLVRLLKDKYPVATLSRGYKRKTKGFAIAGPQTTAIEIGDEPMQFHQKFPDVTVAVGEERLIAIPQLLHEKPDTKVIILDDAYQHRAVVAGMNLLLTAYDNLYVDDFLVPAGSLRDIPSAAKRAQVIVVTKCPSNLLEVDKQKVIKKLKPLPNQYVFFTAIDYGQPYHLYSKTPSSFLGNEHAFILTGVANPDPLIAQVQSQFKSFEVLQYPDHHIFNLDDLQHIQSKYESIKDRPVVIFTTEKDGVRLEKFEKALSEFNIYVLPIAPVFLFNEGNKFDQLILDYVASYHH